MAAEHRCASSCLGLLAAWLDHLALGKPCVLATAREARRTLEVTLAIERSAASGKAVALPLAK